MNAITRINHAPTVTATPPQTDNFADPHDITDVWNSDVNSENSATIEAHFNHNWDGVQFNPALIGLTFNDGVTAQHLTERGAIERMGTAAICRIESAYSEGLSE